MFEVATELTAPIRQDALQLDLVFLKERNYPVIEQISGGQGVLLVIQLSECHSRIRVNERLLVDAPHTLQCAHVERVLGAQVARMLTLDLTFGFTLLGQLLQSRDLRFGQNEVLLRRLGFQRLQAFLHGLQIVPQPHTSHPAG